MALTSAGFVAQLLAVSCLIMLAACAPSEPLEFRPRPDMIEVAKALNCPSYLTPTCIERVNKPYSCSCMDKELLLEILDPEVR